MIKNITTLGWIQDTFAKQLLNKAAKQVTPILKKRKWTIGCLCEFFPKRKDLLGQNTNRGELIEIKCRTQKNKPDCFYSYNHILGTLLHEIVHIEHKLHNAQFYKLLDQLWEEYESMYTSTKDMTLVIQGQKLNTTKHNPSSTYRAKRLAAAAAENRAKKQKIMGSGKLGGERKIGLTPRQAAAEAAIKRYKDNLWCGTHCTPT